MYTLVSFTSRGAMIHGGLSLGQAFRILRAVGRGAIFRSDRPDPHAYPVYPRGRHGDPAHRPVAMTS